MKKKRNGFTLVELLAVIAVLSIILIIAVPQAMNVVDDSKKGVLASSARLIANSAENIKLSNDTMGINTELECSDVSKISASDYEDCTIEFVNGEALVTIIGKGKYEGLSVCKATSEDAEVIEGNCTTGSGSSGGSTESGGGSSESTDSGCFTYIDVSDDTLGVQGISITDYDNACTKDVVIPSKIDNKTVITIGEKAFNLNNLTSVTIPSSVTSIGYGAFNDNKLEDEYAYIYKRNSDGSIDNTYVVSYGGISKDIVIPNNITTIGSNVFEYNDLTSVTIPDSVTSIENFAFQSNQLTSVTIPDSVTSIGYGVFQYNNLTSVTIPDSVTTIGSLAFGYNSLASVTIGNSVTSIGSYAFKNNNLTSVTIPSSVTSIGYGAFNDNKLEDKYAYIYKRNSDGSIDNTHVVSYGGISKDIVIPSNITTIGFCAFEDNDLTSVTIPDSVTTIKYAAFQSNQLTSVTIPNSVTTIDNKAFNKSSSSNPNLTSIINTTGRSFDWEYIITGTSGTSSITGTYNGVNVTTK